MFLVILLGLFVHFSSSSLLFPSTSPPYYSFIVGFGIPVEDIQESVTVGYIVRTQFFTPNRADELRTDYLRPIPLHGRQNRGIVNITRDDEIRDLTDFSRYRWMIYTGIEKVIDKLGFQGHECLLRTICEYGNSDFHYETGLLGEVLHIIFTPSSSVDGIINPKGNEYFHAEYLGKAGVSCEGVFKKCRMSLMDNISRVIG